jgi:hypothetical protein
MRLPSVDDRAVADACMTALGEAEPDTCLHCGDAA